jgi:hypothetical protein
MYKERWVSMLRAAGPDEDGMSRWHQQFEKQAPEAHQDFLESLGLSRQEIRNIRRWSSEERIGPDRDEKDTHPKGRARKREGPDTAGKSTKAPSGS